MSALIGQPISRVDGCSKVTGAARYAADVQLPGLAHAALVQATIPRGRIAAIDDRLARQLPGVITVVTHDNAPRLPYRRIDPRPIVDPQSGDQLHVFQDDLVHFSGQPIAVVVAESWEQAAAAAALVDVDYSPDTAVTDFNEASRQARPPEGGKPADLARGNADIAYANQAIRVDVSFVQPSEFHNAIELHATVANWDGGRLTLFDKTQWVDNDRDEIAHVFGIPADRVRIISPFVGGAFGSGLRTWPHVTIAALAAQVTRRPVKLVLTRRQLFSSIGYRPRTVQRVRLGAGQDGRLGALIHEALAQTSAYEDYAETVVDAPAMLYSVPNMRTGYRLVPMNVNSPCPMRGPGFATGVLALEVAMDELAEAAGVDPIELRLRNHAERDEKKDLPWSSKSLRECYRLGAERFGWRRRPTQPASRREDGLLVGYGMATAVFPTHREAASARAEIQRDGTILVTSAASDMGRGTYTSMSQVAAEALGLPLAAIRFDLGDTEMPSAPVHGGSMTLASVGSAVQAACKAVRSKCRKLGGNPRNQSDYAALLAEHGLDSLAADGVASPGDEVQHYSMYAFGSVFAEARVDLELGQVKVPRILGVYAAGRIVNPKIARSQCIGGMVGGLGMALTEKGLWDARFGRIMNASLTDYLVPVNADIPWVEALFVDEKDEHVNPLGVKGLAEIALVGVAPAIVNAIYNATGRRISELPITREKLMA